MPAENNWLRITNNRQGLGTMLNLGRFNFSALLTVLLLLIMLLIGRLAYLYSADYQRFPINTIKIEAPCQHVTHMQLENLLANYNGYSFFFPPCLAITT